MNRKQNKVPVSRGEEERYNGPWAKSEKVLVKNPIQKSAGKE